MADITPFEIHIDPDAVSDLKQRLANTRWPEPMNAGTHVSHARSADNSASHHRSHHHWPYGTDLNYLQALIEYWHKDFDWYAQQDRLNQLPQFQIQLDGLNTHFVHQPSPHAKATPLIICHGWPGSIAEFQALIPLLTEPEKFGGRPEDAYHVVCPSLPGYGWSEAATAPGMSTRVIARRHIALMAALGYDRYIAQGGDWGSWITRHMADLDPEHCRAIHLNLVLASPPAELDDPLSVATEAERQAFAQSERINKDGMGYFKLQSTKPQTLSYGLTDSPTGLCAWLTEKYQAWTDCGGEIRNAIDWDQLLTIISIYWFTNTIGSSTRLYYEETQNRHKLPFISVPTGAAIYPNEIVQSPKAWIEARYNLQHYFRAKKGGHFAALEQPETFARDLWAFKKAVLVDL